MSPPLTQEDGPLARALGGLEHRWAGAEGQGRRSVGIVASTHDPTALCGCGWRSPGKANGGVG